LGGSWSPFIGQSIEIRPKVNVGLGQWTIDIVRVLAKEDLAKLQEGVEGSLDTAARAYDLLNATKADMDELESRKDEVRRTFGATDAAAIASVPLIEAENALRTNMRGVVTLDVLFYELALTFSSIGNSMQSAGMTSEASRIRLAAKTMRDWRSEVAQQLYPRMDAARDDRGSIERDFERRLAARRLRRIMDSDKPGYFEALAEAASRATGVAVEGPLIGISGPRIGMSGYHLGLVVTVAGVVYAIIICTTILTVLFKVSDEVDKYFGSTAAAKAAAEEFQKRQTMRKQAVQQGELTPKEAAAETAADIAATKAAAEAAALLAAAKGGSTFENILYGTLAAGAGLLLLRVFKLI
jgi:hypothetical protein